MIHEIRRIKILEEENISLKDENIKLKADLEQLDNDFKTDKAKKDKDITDIWIELVDLGSGK